MYTPDAGDVVWIDLSPQAGHETKGRHPAVVLTQARYSIATGLALIVPVTSKAKGSPFEVTLAGRKVRGVALANELRTTDYLARNTEKFDDCPPKAFAEIRDIALALIQGE